MTKMIDLNAELAKLTMLEGRSPTTTEAETNGAVAQFAPYRDGAIFGSKFSGTSNWERHPHGDEIVQIANGSTTLHLVASEGHQSLRLAVGMVAIVPQGAWHRFEAPDGVSLITVTPLPTEHLAVGDPQPL